LLPPRWWQWTTEGARVDGERCDEGAESGANEVLLTGRVSGEPQERELPSGDRVVQFRVVVRRATPRPGGGSRASVDTIDVSCWTKALQRKALRCSPGDAVTVHGALRRRFWRAPGGPASRYEVEVTALERHRGTSRT
jgi:single-strand DNA-binding protein